MLVEYPKGYRDPDNLIEKDVHGGSIRREAAPKSPDTFAEEIHEKVDRHGVARYSKDRCWSVIECALILTDKGESRWYHGAALRPLFGRSVFVLELEWDK